MTYHIKALGLAAALALAPVAASAATVTINFQEFGNIAGGSTPDIGAAIAERDLFIGSAPIIRSEDFEGFTACPNDMGCASADSAGPIVSTSVGDFLRIGGATGSGNSQVDPKDKIVVRNDNPDNSHGRYDVDGGSNWLDSNDHMGIRWEIPGSSGLSDIMRIAFFLTDVDDVNNFAFQINTVGGDVADQIVNNKPGNGRKDGELLLVTMLFDKPVSLLNIDMRAGNNDGFGMDGIRVAAVPLPAGGLLLLTALGGAAVLRRRKRAV